MLTVIVQAGGESRRMGQDKALAPFLGAPLIQRVLERVSELADELLVVTNRPENYTFLGFPTVTDLIPGRGALGGLYTALSASRYPLVAVVACDMPFANTALLSAERDLLEDTVSDAVIPRTLQGTEPFHAVYRRETCLPLVQAALDQDRWRVDSWFHAARIYFLSPEHILLYDPHQLAFWNVNTPDDLLQAELIAQEKD